MTTDDPTSGAKALILGYLAGTEDPERRPALFEDDLIMLAVARVGRTDPTWLTRQIEAERWPGDRRRVIGDLHDAVGPPHPTRVDEPSPDA